MAFLLNGQPLAVDTPFTDANGTRYPANWLRLSTPEEKAAIGIVEVPDPAPYDQRFYWGYDGDNRLIPKDHAQLVEQWTSQTYQIANSLLTPTDWMVIREADNGKAVPEDVRSWREAIRGAAKQKASAIRAAATIGDLASVVLAPEFSEWPEKG
jgi:hypothetical protein